MKIPSHLQEKKKTMNNIFIQKLVICDFFSLNNITISNYIKSNIPYYHENFLPIQSHKYVKINNTETQYMLVIIENKKKMDFYEIFSSLNYKKTINTIFNGFNTLLISCQIMKKYGIVHFNISPESIIFDNYRPYIHNFSQGFLIQSINEERKSILFSKYCPYYIHRPPSYHILCYINQNNVKEVSIGIIDFILQNYIECAIKQGLQMSDEDWSKFREHWTNHLVNKKNDVLLLKESIYWDIYGLCILYYIFLLNLNTTIILEKFLLFLKKNICEYHSLETLSQFFIE